MNDQVQDAVLKQAKSIKTAVWILALCAVICTIITASMALPYMKLLKTFRARTARPEYQETLHKLIGDGKYDEALELARRKQSSDPRDAYAWYSSGLAYYHMKDWTNALHDMTEAQNLSPTWEKDYTGPYIKTIRQMLSSKKK